LSLFAPQVLDVSIGGSRPPVTYLISWLPACAVPFMRDRVLCVELQAPCTGLLDQLVDHRDQADRAAKVADRACGVDGAAAEPVTDAEFEMDGDR
jgi:hypothetical protein